MTSRDRLIIGVVTLVGAVVVAAACVAVGVSTPVSIVFGIAFGAVVLSTVPRLRRPS